MEFIQRWVGIIELWAITGSIYDMRGNHITRLVGF